MRAFETIGSATLIAYDDRPILTNDAWINDSAFFGSWQRSHEIPPAQMAAIRAARFHWFSHGHPDHLNLASLAELSGGQILLSDHYGSRMANDLTAMGLDVRVLPDHRWISLSPAIRIYSIANQNQDSVLLVDINGRLVINLNDSPDYGAVFRIRRIARAFRPVYCLQLHCWGGTDMANLYDEAGAKLTSPHEYRLPIAPRAQRGAATYGADFAIPFSSFHRFQRSDSLWANALTPALADYQTHALPTGPRMLPAFVRVDCETDEVTELDPDEVPIVVRRPEEFGDSWSDPLTAGDKARIDAYFRRCEGLHDHFGFIEVRCGGVSTSVRLNRDKPDVGITFEAPRASFMRCVTDEIFDDLLSGNFMRTTLHGVRSLYPDFSPIVGKYADNGRARTRSELKTYFGHYATQDPVGHALKKVTRSSEMVLRRLLPEQGPLFERAKKLYYRVVSPRRTRGSRSPAS